MSAAVQSASPSQFSPPPRMGDLDGPAASPEDEEAASLELAMRLQLEEEAWMAQQQAGMAQQQAMEETADEDEESLALAIRLQQEDDDEQLRLALGVQNDERGSPGSYSYEQLMNLTETVGTVSRGASDESIGALPTVTFKCCDSSVNMGTKCSICQEEFEEDDELRVLPCKHAEHAACMDQWLRVNKCCPICQAEVPAAAA